MNIFSHNEKKSQVKQEHLTLLNIGDNVKKKQKKDTNKTKMDSVESDLNVT